MTEQKELKPGWLKNVLHDAMLRCMADHSYDWWQHVYGNQFKVAQSFPIGWEEGEELLELMSNRFKSWTGRSIEDHIKARPH